MSAARSKQRVVILVLGGALASTASLGLGQGHAARPCANPNFAPARGWHVAALGSMCGTIGRTLSASTIPFAPADRLSSAPTQTVRSLPPDGVVVWAQFQRSGVSTKNDRSYPKRRLPLRLAEARGSLDPEGFAAPGKVLHLLARAHGYDVFIFVFFGALHPRTAQLQLADMELQRLRLP
jgi:hypothetical protein